MFFRCTNLIQKKRMQRNLISLLLFLYNADEAPIDSLPTFVFFICVHYDLVIFAWALLLSSTFSKNLIDQRLMTWQ